ncbi:hypothetical protein Q1695_004511 [Nippostrongylus brasiliensis]|nr:hypothetical protein Q1695_004511 [Nippostrongylus brasiliensis]
MFIFSNVALCVWLSQIPIGAVADELSYRNEVSARLKRGDASEGSGVQQPRGENGSRNIDSFLNGVIGRFLTDALKSEEVTKKSILKEQLQTGAIYWLCKAITTYEFPKKAVVAAVAKNMTPYQQNRKDLDNMLQIADKVIEELSTNRQMLFILVVTLGVWSSQTPVVAAGLLRTDEAFARQKRSDVVEGSTEQKPRSRFLSVIDSHLRDALKTDDVRANSTLKAVLKGALESLRQIASQADDNRKLHVTLRVLTQVYSLRTSLMAAIKRPDSDYVRNVVSVLYWTCQSITTYNFSDANKVKTLVAPLSVYSPTEKTLKETLGITLQVIKELLKYFKASFPEFFR